MKNEPSTSHRSENWPSLRSICHTLLMWPWRVNMDELPWVCQSCNIFSVSVHVPASCGGGVKIFSSKKAWENVTEKPFLLGIAQITPPPPRCTKFGQLFHFCFCPKNRKCQNQFGESGPTFSLFNKRQNLGDAQKQGCFFSETSFLLGLIGRGDICKQCRKNHFN